MKIGPRYSAQSLSSKTPREHERNSPTPNDAKMSRSSDWSPQSPTPAPKPRAAGHWSPGFGLEKCPQLSRGSEKDREVDWGRLSSAGGEQVQAAREGTAMRKEKVIQKYLPPKVAVTFAKKTRPIFLPIAVAGRGLGKDEREMLCYNCGKKGHCFVDCLAGCGRCQGDGHRTMDCKALRPRHGI